MLKNPIREARFLTGVDTLRVEVACPDYPVGTKLWRPWVSVGRDKFMARRAFKDRSEAMRHSVEAVAIVAMTAGLCYLSAIARPS